MKQNIIEKFNKCIESNWFHIALILIGVIFILLGAFHTELWFDESYTIALLRHDFEEIIRIDIGDVHPVLYYLLLKVFTLIFGNNILVCRLFSVLAGILIGVIGFTHIRKDFGAKVGVAYTFLAFFLPFASVFGSEIRMYSWTMLFTTLSGIYAYRTIKENKVKNWALFALFSLGAAHCHYYGLVSVAIINGLLFLHILFSKKMYQENGRTKKNYLIAFFITALVEILGYLPWLPIFLKQATAVSKGYWITLNWGDTVAGPLGVQFNGRLSNEVTAVYTVIMYAYLIYQIICNIIQNRKATRENMEQEKSKMSLIVYSLLVHFILFFGMLIVTLTVKPIMYYRYMLITTGIFIFSFAYFIVSGKTKHQKIISCFVIVITLILSIYNNVRVIKRNYNDTNKAEIQYIQEQYNKLKEQVDLENAKLPEEEKQDVIILYTDIYHGTNIQVQMPEYNWYLYHIGTSFNEKDNFCPPLKLTVTEDFLEKYKGKLIIIDHEGLEWYNEIAEKYGLKEIDKKTMWVGYNELVYGIVTAEK